jgi:hypothetical protein
VSSIKLSLSASLAREVEDRLVKNVLNTLPIFAGFSGSAYLSFVSLSTKTLGRRSPSTQDLIYIEKE